MESHKTTFLPQRTATLALVAVAVATLALGLLLRFALIENAALGRICEASAGSIACPLRQLIIEFFLLNGFGILAVAAAAINFWHPSVAKTAVALVAAALGLVLFNTALSSIAVGLIVLSLARPSMTTASRPEPAGRH